MARTKETCDGKHFMRRGDVRIVVAVDQEEQQTQGLLSSETPPPHETLTIPASSEVLIEASQRLGASLHGGFREAQSHTISVVVPSWDEMEMLLQIVERAHTRVECYVTSYLDPLDSYLIDDHAAKRVARMLVTATDFYFEKCQVDCAKWLATKFFGDFLFQPQAFIMDKLVISTLEDAAPVWNTPLHPLLLTLPPLALKAIIDQAMRHFHNNNVYTAVCCYLVQSPHCEDLDEGGLAGIFKMVMEGAFQKSAGISPWYAAHVLGVCPFLRQMDGGIPRGVLTSLGKNPEGGIHVNIRVKVTEGEEPQYYPLGIYLGVPLFLRVARGVRFYKYNLAALLPLPAEDDGAHFTVGVRGMFQCSQKVPVTLVPQKTEWQRAYISGVIGKDLLWALDIDDNPEQPRVLDLDFHITEE